MKVRNFLYACMSVVFAFVISGQANAADTAALVSDVAGNVIVKANGDSAPVKLLAAIQSGARIDLPKGAKLSLIYVAKGDEYQLSGPGSYRIDAFSPQTISGDAPAKQVSIGGALRGKKIRLANVVHATLTMRGGANIRPGLDPLMPSDSISLADPLQFYWREPAAGLVYKIQLKDRQNKVLISKEVLGNTFILPQKIQLDSGGSYVWSLSTTMPDGTLVTSSAQFRVASNEVRVLAAKIRPAKSGTVSERVVYGLWLEAENLDYDARLAWEEIASEFPDQPNVFDRAASWP